MFKQAKELGASQTVNYKEKPDWEKEVLKVHPEGIDHIIEVGGKETAAKASACVKLNGNIYVVGGLSGFDASFTAWAIVSKAANIRGILAGIFMCIFILFIFAKYYLRKSRNVREHECFHCTF
jgi:NADPH:quinone reductase-like Zn-dependent oxidoreductase